MKPTPDEQSVFAEALLLETAEARDAYLDRACPGDPALRQRIESLLKAADQAGDFLERPHLESGVEGPGAGEVTEGPGDVIGRYKLLQTLGEGGCGVVYMAEQLEPVRRRVAFKVIKLGMDTRQVIARFEAERQALAMMDHPNIAKVLDAGATGSGRPFFVMELVRGTRITDFCDQNQLSTEVRLKLFIKVCGAIQHAHQKGVIHRDIKPSNILVTVSEPGAEGCPTVIDFGIAKATSDLRLTDKTVFTAFEQFIGTPAYMSPEQAMMTTRDIDTRTDIYALGVLLYELLTGHTPFETKDLLAAGLDAMRRMIREQEPARPSTRLSTLLEADLTLVARHRHAEPAKLGTLLRGDLDWIVMKAIEKDRTRRYETANGLAADIQRHLANETVTARPPGNSYRFQKLVERNKLSFAAAGAVTAALTLGLGISTWLFFKEKQAHRRAVAAENDQRQLRQQAETELVESRRLAMFLGNLANDLRSSPDTASADSTYREWMGMRLRVFGKEHPEAEVVLTSLARALQQGRPAQGDPLATTAMERCHAAMPLFESIVSDPRRTEECWYFANGYENLGQLFAGTGATELTEQAYRDTHPLWEKMVAATNEEDHRWHLAINHDLLGDLLRQSGRYSEALEQYQRAHAIWTDLVARFGMEDRRLRLAINRRSSGEALNAIGRLDAAREAYAEAQIIWDKLVADFDNAYYRNERFGNLMKLVAADAATGRSLEAESIWREELALCRKSRGGNSLEMAGSLSQIADFLITQAQFPEAESMIRESLEIRRKLLGNDHQDVATTLHKLSEVLRESGRLSEAEELCREVLALRRKLGGDGDEDLGHALHLLAWTLHLEGRDQEAEALSREELALRRKLFGNEHDQVAWTLQDLTTYLRFQNRLPEAEDSAREALAIRRKRLGDDHPEVAYSLNLLAGLLVERGKLAEAEALYREELAARKRHFGDVSREVDDALVSLARLLQQAGRLAEAESVWREELAMERKLSGDEHVFVANSLSLLATVLGDSGKLSEAESTLREALAMRRKLQGDSYPDIAALQARLAMVLLAQERFGAAESVARECLAIREKVIPDDWRTFNTRSLLGGSLLGQKKLAEAEPLLLSGYNGMKQREESIPAAGKARLSEALQRLVDLYQDLGETQKAEDYKATLARLKRPALSRETVPSGH